MPDVTIYTKPGCPYCAKAVEHYCTMGTAYRKIDIYAIPGPKIRRFKFPAAKQWYRSLSIKARFRSDLAVDEEFNP
nr:hypothetical protein [candidate division Zixibacteria bacterium]